MKRNPTILKKLKDCLATRQLIIATVGLLLILNGHKAMAQPEFTKATVEEKSDTSILVTDSAIVAIASVKTGNFASIGDFVWIDNNVNGIQDNGEPGLPNIEVVLYDSLLNILDTRYTNDSGYYQFNNIDIPAYVLKTFMVGFNNIPPNYAYTNLVADSLGQFVNSKSDTISGRTRPFVLHTGEIRKDIDGGIKNAPGVVLPLIINQFNGNYSDGFIQLGWSTYSEINVDHFDIERSTDGINFRQVGRVGTAGGQLSSRNNYTYMDITAQRGNNYYRLAIVDNNGNYTYSKAIMVNVDVKGISVMIVYPNPFSRRVKIRVNCDKAEKVMVNVINSNGILMSSQQAETTVGDNNIDVTKVESLPGGIYFIEVVSSTRSLKTKVMKLN
jgi:hypothetical protein